MTTISLNHTGKLEIPPGIRHQLGIATIQSFNFDVRNSCIVLQPIVQAPTTVHHHESTIILDTPSFCNLAPLIDDLLKDRTQSCQSA